MLNEVGWATVVFAHAEALDMRPCEKARVCNQLHTLRLDTNPC